MTELTLIRHGQAQTGAQDEKSYDSLSDLGHSQARRLGTYFRQSPDFDRIVSSAMNRQIQTAQSLGHHHTPHVADARLNELDYFGLAADIHSVHGVPFPKDEAGFQHHVLKVLEHWQKGDICSTLETYDDFCARILGALKDATQHEGRVLLVTSTGVIATLATLALGLDVRMKSKMFLSVAHTSVHKFELRGDELHLTQFGATPHLDGSDRLHQKTFV